MLRKNGISMSVFLLFFCSLFLIVGKGKAAVSNDLSLFLTKVEINAETDENGNYLINPNNPYEITLNFEENEFNQFDDFGQLYYNFPSGLLVSNLGNTSFEIEVTDELGTVIVGDNKFRVEDNQLLVDFNQSDPNFSRLTAASNAKFRVDISSFFDPTVVEIIFNTLIVKNFIYNEISNLIIWKSVVYDMEEDTAFYELVITSIGHNSNVIIEDRTTGTALTFNRDVTVESSLHGALNPDIDYNSIENGFRFTISSMDNNEVLTLHFSATVDNNKISGNGTAEQTNNTAKVSSEQLPDGREAYADFHGQVNFQKINKNKSGDPVQISEHEYEITWNIQINNDHKQTVGGETIYDWIDTPSRPFMWFTGTGITIEVTYENGSNDTRILDWESLNTQSNTNGIYSWTYVPPVSDGKASYLITGTTHVDTSAAYGDLTVTNGAQILLNYNGANATIGNPGIGSITAVKRVTADTSEYTDWEIRVTVPGAGLPDFRIVDDLPRLIDSGITYIDHIVDGSLTVDGLIETESYNYYLGSSERTFSLVFFKDHEQNQYGLLPSEDGADRTITVNFRSTVNQDWLDLTENSQYTQFVLHRNNASVRVNDFRVPASADALPVRPVIDKQSTEVSSIDIEGVIYPIFRYVLTLFGPTEDGAEIQDIFDTTYFRFYSDEGIKILGGDSINPTDPNGIVTAVDNESGIQINVISFPKKTNGQFYKLYTISYTLIPKDLETLKDLNRVTSETGEFWLTNYAVWNNLISNEASSVYTYYPYVDKEILTQPSSENGYVAEFRMVINKYADDLDPTADVLTIQDELSENLRFIPDSFMITPNSSLISIQYDKDTNTITINNLPDETRFEVTYRARVLGYGNAPYSNTIRFGKYEKIIEEVVVIESSGGGSASNPSITLIKRDTEDLTSLLSGAVFQLSYLDETALIPVMDNNGDHVTFTTDQSGSVLILGNMHNLGWTLWEGRTYCLIEKSAPFGYEINTAPACFVLSEFPQSQIEYDITGDHINIQNDPIMISIPVEKTWVGAPLNSVTIQLFANDLNTGKTLELSAENHWHGVFDRIRKYDKNGREIIYRIEEEPFDNYQIDYISLDNGGYMVINTENIDISVKKEWFGSEKSVTINLLSDGEQVQHVELSSENNWQHIFEGLPKYDPENGHEIQYSVSEDPVAGYMPEYEGSVTNGFIIRNRLVWTATPTQTNTPQPTSTPLPTLTPTAIATATETCTPVPTITSTATSTNIPTKTPTMTYTPTTASTATLIPTNTITPTVKPTRPPFFEREEELPKTGFLNNHVWKPQSVKYTSLYMELEIPTLNISSDIVAVERWNGYYPVEWLEHFAGVMADAAIPGQGISVIVGHNTINEAEFGPFALIGTLEKGDRFFINSDNGVMMIFEIYANEKISRYDIDRLYSISSTYPSTVTLLTCEDENMDGYYASRRIVAGRQVY